MSAKKETVAEKSKQVATTKPTETILEPTEILGPEVIRTTPELKAIMAAKMRGDW
jgi:hypothetical protein